MEGVFPVQKKHRWIAKANSENLIYMTMGGDCHTGARAARAYGYSLDLVVNSEFQFWLYLLASFVTLDKSFLP